MLTDCDIHQLVSRFNVEVQEEASVALHYIWRDDPAKSSALPDCITALTEDEELYRVLKLAHAHGVYDVVRKWEQIPLPLLTPQDTAVKADVHRFLTELQPTIRKLVVGDIVLPTWSPSGDYLEPETIAHLNSLKIPLLKGKPNLLLHDLGSFTLDALLEKRLKNIFMPNNHTFLVNTSGSGKTRLLLEGLCENWGFYFTSCIDSSLLGSSDVYNSIRANVPHSSGFRRNLPSPSSPAYEAALKTNREIASRIFRQIFLARLMIFNLFAETMSNYIKANPQLDDIGPQIYKARWLLLQLQPSFVHSQVWDVFDQLSSKLSGASDSYINMTTKTLLSTVRSNLSSAVEPGDPTADLQMSTAETAQTPLFCVLDEAQYAATQLDSSFRSDQNGSCRPILREIVKAWEGQSFGQGVFMVVAGTGISKDVVDQAMASAIMKDSRYRWCSDTGAFDRQDVQARYLRKYLPQSLLQTESGARLLERVWYWLHGRHRFTAGYVSDLLIDCFKRPHGLLNAYVKHFTDFEITDASMFVKAEGSDALPLLSHYKLDFSKLMKNTDMLTTIHQLTAHYLMRSAPPPTTVDEATYVEYGFARFIDAETTKVAVDEPLVLLAATHCINVKHRTSYKIFAKEIEIREQSSNGFENYIAFCIDIIFSKQKRRLNEVFEFKGSTPSWCKLEAELVSLHRTVLDDIEASPIRHFHFSGSSVNLGIKTNSPEETSKWLEHRSHSPICFPHESMGPDLMFVLRLSDGSLIWVALQAKYSKGIDGSLSRQFLRHALRSVTPRKFFLDKDGKVYSPASHHNLVDETNRRLLALPHRRTDAGKYSLLRIVASFPAETKLSRSFGEDPDDEGHPVASLDMSLVKKVTAELSPTRFLQRLQDLSKGKRKRGAEYTKTTRSQTKKLKLN
ncbi:hypothetical protein BYT27DRAFT_7285678 [Phlegmacium glaucopus]|nr:hypothetical protein BYT27DRAFT_7285678 [Phlegmacium glaucopus]